MYEEKYIPVEKFCKTGNVINVRNNNNSNNFTYYSYKKCLYDPYENESYVTAQSGNFGIVISNATAKWAVDQSENSLENINLTVGPGQLVAITGPVGAGKVMYSTIYCIYIIL